MARSSPKRFEKTTFKLTRPESSCRMKSFATTGLKLRLAMHELTMQPPAISPDEVPKQSPCPKTHLRRPVRAYRCIFAALLNTDANIWLLRKHRTLPQSPRKSDGVSRPRRVSGCFAASLSLTASLSPEFTHLFGLHLVQKLLFPKYLRHLHRDHPQVRGDGQALESTSQVHPLHPQLCSWAM